MSNTEENLAHLIETSAPAYAGFIVSDLSASNPEVISAFGPMATESWRGYMVSRLIELASTVRAGQPRLFAAHIDWCRVALSSRGISDQVLKPALGTVDQMLSEQLPDYVDTFKPYLAASLALFDRPLKENGSLLNVDDPCGRLAAHYVLAVLEGDCRAACELVLNAVKDDLDISDAYIKVLIPAVQEVGRMWHQNEVSIAEEHFVTATTQRVLSQLQSSVQCAPSNGKTVVAAAVAGDRHEVGIRVVADFLEMAGWRVIFLGADLPSSDLAQAVEDFNADIVVLAATLVTHISSVRSAITAIRASDAAKSIKVIVGGSGFNGDVALAKEVGADAFALTPDKAVQLAGQFISKSD